MSTDTAAIRERNYEPLALTEDTLRAMCDEIDALREQQKDGFWVAASQYDLVERHCDALKAENAKLHDNVLGQMKRANDLFVENERLRAKVGEMDEAEYRAYALRVRTALEGK